MAKNAAESPKPVRRGCEGEENDAAVAQFEMALGLFDSGERERPRKQSHQAASQDTKR